MYRHPRQKGSALCLRHLDQACGGFAIDPDGAQIRYWKSFDHRKADLRMAQEPGPAKTRFEDFGRKLDEQVGNVRPRVEEEVRKVITYLNDEVVPQVRQNSSQALRIAAEHLARLAEHLDRKA